MSETCRHSSRVGTRISACVPSARLMWGSWPCRSPTTGARYASVLPDPVGAFTSASLPLCSALLLSSVSRLQRLVAWCLVTDAEISGAVQALE